jgi:hypothetical protein
MIKIERWTMDGKEYNKIERELSALDKAMQENRKRPLTEEELSGFGMAKPEPDTDLTCCPFFKVKMPSKEVGPKKASIIVGVKGTF